MADEQYTFTQARNRLQDIVVQVRKKDVSLEHSLDLLEEGVKLASACTELIDHTEWRAVVEELRAEEAGDEEPEGAWIAEAEDPAVAPDASSAESDGAPDGSEDTHTESADPPSSQGVTPR